MVATGSSIALLKWLAYALAVVAVVSALITLGFQFNVFPAPAAPPDTMDFPERLVAYRAIDAALWPYNLVSLSLGFAAFVLIALVGGGLRQLVQPGLPRDALTILLVVAGVVGMASQLIQLGANAYAASGTYCDCGYKTYEVIGQAKALDIGFSIGNWLILGAGVQVATGAAVAGRIVRVGPAWQTVSYVIAVVLIVSVVLRFVTFYDASDILFGVGSGILVPIWAVLLARGARPVAA